ncbi:MAG: hypothetical protein AAGC56_09385 [Pseudomonadota bacterium]
MAKLKRAKLKRAKSKPAVRARRRFTGRQKLIVAVGGVLCAVSGAIAQVVEPRAPLRFRTDYLGYAASVSPRLIYTDNIDLLPDGQREDDLIASTVFSGAAIFSSPRFTGLLRGDLDLSYLTQAQDFRVNQDVGAVGTFTLADNLFFLDVSGRTTRQLIGDNARFSPNINASRGQRADVNTFSVSPYFHRRFADNSAAELRYRFTKVLINDDDSDFANGFQEFLNDSRTQEVLAAYDSGARFERIRLNLSAYGNETVEEGSDLAPRFEFQQGSLQAAAEVPLSDQFSLSGAIGYDDIETETVFNAFDDEALSGVFWRAGFIARPGRRSFLRLEYGQRYDDDFIDAEASYQVSSRLQVSAGASRTFQTRSQFVNSRFQALTQDTLLFAESLREGAELDPAAVVDAATQFAPFGFEAQTVGIGVSNDAFVQVNGAYDRTAFAVGLNYQDADFGFTTNENYQAIANVTRRLTRRLDAYGGAFYRRSDVGINRAACLADPSIFGLDPAAPGFSAALACDDTNFLNGLTTTVGGQVGLAYRIYENLSLFGEYTRTDRFADEELFEYTENAVALGLTLDL